MRRASGQTALGIIYGLLIAASIGLAASFYWDLQQPPQSRLQQMINDDIRLLETKHKLPPQWKSIREVNFQMTDPNLVPLTEHLHLPILTSAKGNFRLKVFVFSWQSEKRDKTGFVFQYDLENIADKNTVWELSRTYAVGNSVVMDKSINSGIEK